MLTYNKAKIRQQLAPWPWQKSKRNINLFSLCKALQSINRDSHKYFFCAVSCASSRLATEDGIHTTLSGREDVTDFPMSDTAKSSSAGGFSLNTSLPLVGSSGSSGSLRL